MEVAVSVVVLLLLMLSLVEEGVVEGAKAKHLLPALDLLLPPLHHLHACPSCAPALLLSAAVKTAVDRPEF
jgi:hypothetical protein